MILVTWICEIDEIRKFGEASWVSVVFSRLYDFFKYFLLIRGAEKYLWSEKRNFELNCDVEIVKKSEIRGADA